MRIRPVEQRLALRRVHLLDVDVPVDVLREMHHTDERRQRDGEGDHGRGTQAVALPPGDGERESRHDALGPVPRLRLRHRLDGHGERRGGEERQVRVEPLHERASSGVIAAQKNTMPVTTRRAEVVSW